MIKILKYDIYPYKSKKCRVMKIPKHVLRCPEVYQQYDILSFCEHLILRLSSILSRFQHSDICTYINCKLNYTHYYYYELVGPVKYILHDYVFTKYLERSKMISIYVTGCSIGTCILFPIAGLLISHWGWPSVFYMTGLVGIIWCAFWYWLAYDR